MGDIPETAIFRRFGALSAEDLLYRQAELAELEEALREYQDEDKVSNHQDHQRYRLNWEKLKLSGDRDVTEGNDGSQLRTVLEIREKLRDYHEALLRHRNVLNLGAPTLPAVEAVSEWMKRTDMGNVYLEGPDRHIWAKPDLEDLTCLAPPLPERALRSSFVLKANNLYNHIIGRHIHKPSSQPHLGQTIHYTSRSAHLILKTIATVLACLLPISGIAVLYTISSMPARLGAVAAFTALFSLSMALLTSASIQQVFSATAAFAAVLVVFVGTTDSIGSEGSCACVLNP
ncbi:hypothetical protein QBC34DRAFT_311939 [Podospora aff. communis PSN243]|uniref:DUF6594 domain-containing protein n=1 Tax=Podospora aff. communis PSN243 TaxID=3040156 RepID=A0AAV9G4C1_9PEZI|nr:hypothetical protein QBC34DRAFT_311939 [Podospora aff. communis PSN243]